MSSNVLTLAAVGVTDPWFINGAGTAHVVVAPGSDLDFVIEVSPDDTRAANYNAANGSWQFALLPGMNPTASSNIVGALPVCAAARVRITRYNSGSLTFAVIKPGQFI